MTRNDSNPSHNHRPQQVHSSPPETNLSTPRERDASGPLTKDGGKDPKSLSQKNDMPLNAELSENRDIVRLRIDVPGIEPKDIQVSVERGILTVQGTRKSFSIDGKTCLKKRQFVRRYGLDTNAIEAHSVSAALAFGVLEIRAKKKPKVRDGMIPVVGARLGQRRVVIPAEISLLEVDPAVQDKRS